MEISKKTNVRFGIMARVYVSTVVNARNDRVWARVRDFNGLPNWHPAIAESRIEGGEPADKIGCVRDFRLRNGDRIREKLLGLSDYDMRAAISLTPREPVPQRAAASQQRTTYDRAPPATIQPPPPTPTPPPPRPQAPSPSHGATRFSSVFGTRRR